MINDHGARSNDPDESSVAANGLCEMFLDQERPREQSITVRQDSERCQATGWLHGSDPGGPLLARLCSVDLQVLEGLDLRAESGISVELDARLRVRSAEADDEGDTEKPR